MLDKRQFISLCRGKGSGKTESGHPIWIFRSKVAKTVTAKICLLAFLGTISSFPIFPWIVIKSAFVHSMWDLSNKVLFSCA